MPELPEVETTRRGILPRLRGRRIRAVEVREPRLRWPVPPDLDAILRGEEIDTVERRGKYLLVRLAKGTLLIHLGMSGSLRVLTAPPDLPRKHDHIDLLLEDGQLLRYHDPRRFGAFLWLQGDPAGHPLLAELGPEPLGAGFDGDYLFRLSRGRRASVKQFLMDGHVVVGVGNIYANEALYLAGIDPRRAAGRIAAARYARLAAAVRRVLRRAITTGGSSISDYVRPDGSDGGYQDERRVYGRTGEPCFRCQKRIRRLVIGGRSTHYCPGCQR